MFKLEINLQFVNVDTDYLKALHNACPEVYYKPTGYETKPFLGILIHQNGRKYVLPLSSAKQKHKTWKDVDKDRFLIYSITKRKFMTRNSIWIPLNNDDVKLLHSVLDLKKMIPIKDGVYSTVNLNLSSNDSKELVKYKNLLNKEYLFCLKIINSVLEKATKLYDKQMKTGKIIPFCCDFKLLENLCDDYQI